MKLLVLGGTRFLGRHLVDAALARGHDVTIFTRGVTPLPQGVAVRQLVGNRDPRMAPGLAALAAGEWDAAIDTSGYVPRCVKAAADALAGRVGHYTFVSSLSVYADASRPGIDETAPVAALEDPLSEDVKAHYGALKARCEDEIRAVFRDRAFVVRPGLIVGPFDPTDRFAYWVARFRQPGLLGARGEVAIVPGPRERPVQFIDARDLATWILDGVEAGRAGTFNACSPEGMWTMGARGGRSRVGARAGAGMGRRRHARGLRHRALDGAPAVDPRERSGVGRVHGFLLRSRNRARPLDPVARADDRRHCDVARRARQHGRVAQRVVGGAGTGSAGRRRP
jgi:nucleoside-diphosphate-sugar epimerase